MLGLGMKLYKLYYQYRHEVDEPEVFACVCEAEQVEKIEKHYSELYGLLIATPCYRGGNRLTEQYSKILGQAKDFITKKLVLVHG